LSITDRERLLATAQMEKAILRREAGDLAGAVDGYQAALKLLADASAGQDLKSRALVLENFSNTLDELGEFENGLGAIGGAVDDLLAAGESGFAVQADLASAYGNGARKLLRAGDYETSTQWAAAAAARFRDLVAHGSTHLVHELLRVEYLEATGLERQLDMAGALEAVERAVATLQRAPGGIPGGPESFPSVMVDRQEILHGLIHSTAASVAQWQDKIRMRMESGGVLMREDQPEQAVTFFEDGVCWAAFLRDQHAAHALDELIAESAAALAFAGYRSGRPALVVRGGKLAMGANWRLVERGAGPERLEALASSGGALAGMLAHLGTDEAAEAFVAETADLVGRVDRERGRAAGAAAQAQVEEGRAVRSG
jgi:tetratricopeptide (TPR) repeat protein